MNHKIVYTFNIILIKVYFTSVLVSILCDNVENATLIDNPMLSMDNMFLVLGFYGYNNTFFLHKSNRQLQMRNIQTIYNIYLF